MNPIRHLIVPVCQMEVPSVLICFFREPFSPCLLKTFSRTPSFFSMHSPEAVKLCWDNQVCQTLFTYTPMVQMILFFYAAVALPVTVKSKCWLLSGIASLCLSFVPCFFHHAPLFSVNAVYYILWSAFCQICLTALNYTVSKTSWAVNRRAHSLAVHFFSPAGMLNHWISS